jgi:hypothetical protein
MTAWDMGFNLSGGVNPFLLPLGRPKGMMGRSPTFFERELTEWKLRLRAA